MSKHALAQFYFAHTIEEAKTLLKKAHINVLMEYFNGKMCRDNENLFFDASADLLKNSFVFGNRKKVLRHIISRYAAARLTGKYGREKSSDDCSLAATVASNATISYALAATLTYIKNKINRIMNINNF